MPSVSAASGALLGALPQDRGAALGRDHRIDRVLQHQHLVADAIASAPPEPPSPMMVTMIGTSQLRHLVEVAADRLGLAALLGVDARDRRRACRRR